MLSELEQRIREYKKELTKDTYGHIGLVLQWKLKTLDWVLKQIKEIECGQVGSASD